jgi:hypothetical protein
MDKQTAGIDPAALTAAVDLERRDALRAVLAMLAGVTITISGCGGGGGGNSGGGGSPTGSTGTGNGDKVGNISSNHGHTAVITAAQLMAGGALQLNIRGNADHQHTVDLSAAEISSIAAGQRVGKGSSEDSFHTHTVTFN